MGACCSDLFGSDPPDVLLISVEDGSVTVRSKAALNPFDGLKFNLSALRLRAGPLCTFAVPEKSPEGILPFLLPQQNELLKALRNHALFHGGEQMLAALSCEVQHSDFGNKNNKGPRLLALTSLGRLFVVKGSKVVTSCHAVHVASATCSNSTLTLIFNESSREPWRISSTRAAAQHLQACMWLLNAVANAQLLMKVNWQQAPVQLLPPLAVDGNLHSSYVMMANARELEEPEIVLQGGRSAAMTSPAYLCIRQWTTRMEADVTEWTATALTPLADALKHNTAMLALKAKDAPHLAPALTALGETLRANSRLIVLSLENVGGTPASMAALLAGLAANPLAMLSVINLNDNQLGTEGGQQLALAVQRLRPGLLAELHLRRCGLDPSSAHAVLSALQPQQFNLLQLHLDDNHLDGPACAALAGALMSLRKLEQLSIPRTRASLAPLAPVPAGSLRSVQALDLSAIPWDSHILTLVDACGPSLRSLNLSYGMSAAARNTRAGFLQALFGRCARVVVDLSHLTDAAFYTDVATALGAGYSPAGLSLCDAKFTGGGGPIDLGESELVGLIRAAGAARNLSGLKLDRSFANTQGTGAALGALVRDGCLARLSLAGNQRGGGGHAIGGVLEALFHNTTLTFLDISDNMVGDASIYRLAEALKVNRTLTALRIDGNGVRTDGLKALKMCLNGNKKLIDFPLPDSDIAGCLAALANEYKGSLAAELSGRQVVKSAYGRHGYCVRSRWALGPALGQPPSPGMGCSGVHTDAHTHTHPSLDPPPPFRTRSLSCPPPAHLPSPWAPSH